MEFIHTVQLVKTGKDGKERVRHWDFVKNQQGFAIQRNGYTVYGRLSGYGGNQIFTDLIQSDLQNGWKRETDDYTHWHKDSIISDK